MPLVSVVVPTHNRPEFLAEALASVRAQTFTDHEIIVVSNGEGSENRGRSQTVATLGGAQWFALTEGNLSAARNFGIDQAKGEWIAFLDDDDLWLPQKLEQQLAEAERTGAAMIAADYVEFYLDGCEIVVQPRLCEGWSYTKALNHLNWWAAPSAVIVRRAALGEIRFDPRLRYGEDGDLWRRVSWRHKIHEMHETLVRVRRGHPSLTRQVKKMLRYDLIHFAKMHLDTPHDLRGTLAPIGPVWNRLLILSFPAWLRRRLELEPWSGPKWSRLLPNKFRRWLRPRTRIMQLRGHLKIRMRVKAAAQAIANVVGL